MTTRFGHQFGGAEAYGVELMRELSKRHRITVIGYEYDPHSALKLSFIPVHINNRLPSWIRSYLFAKKVSQILKQHSFQIVHSHVGGWCGDVDVLHVRSAYYRWFVAPKLIKRLANYLSPRAQIYRWLEKRRIHLEPRRCTVMVSEQIKKQIQSVYKTQFDFPVIPPGVHIPLENADLRKRTRERLGVLEGDLLCLLVALNPERKGLNTLLESLPRLPRHAKLLVVGVGEHQLSMYEQLAISHGLKERILFVPQTTDISPYFQASDIYVHPTLNDSFGMAPLEAMSYSLPVIMSSSYYCGFAHYARDQKNALLLQNPNDSAELTKALLGLINNDQLREQLALQGKQLAQQFDWQNIAANFEDVYANILSNKNHAQHTKASATAHSD
ncbi:MAG TPA: glycosyltransferase family 4 protein [Paenalcaligenes sp.]|nr:glycosyltransferase family 4 protein [Paenalcaligenes sp.]